MAKFGVWAMALGFALLTMAVAWLGAEGIVDDGFAQVTTLALPGIAAAAIYARRPCMSGQRADA